MVWESLRIPCVRYTMFPIFMAIMKFCTTQRLFYTYIDELEIVLIIFLFLQRLVRMWSSSEEHLRVLAFLSIRKISLLMPQLFDFILKVSQHNQPFVLPLASHLARIKHLRVDGKCFQEQRKQKMLSNISIVFQEFFGQSTPMPLGFVPASSNPPIHKHFDIFVA